MLLWHAHFFFLNWSHSCLLFSVGAIKVLFIETHILPNCGSGNGQKLINVLVNNGYKWVDFKWSVLSSTLITTSNGWLFWVMSNFLHVLYIYDPPPFPLNFWQKYWMSVCSPDVNLVDFTKWYMFVVCIAGIYILANVLNDVMHFPHILSQCCIFNGQYWKCFTFI